MAQAWRNGVWRTNALAEGSWTQGGNVPVISNGDPPGGSQDVAYTFTFTATGDAPITWSVTVGALPDGLTLSAAGVLSGTPTTPESQTFTVTATNVQGTDTAEYTIVIGTAASGGEAGARARNTSRGLLRLVSR